MPAGIPFAIQRYPLGIGPLLNISSGQSPGYINQELQAQIDAFGVAHAEEIVWLGLNSPKFEFAQSLAQAPKRRP